MSCLTEILFVTGKGGVGKTTVSAALSLLAASKGKRTLVCELDAKGDLASSFETAPTTFDAREVAPRLWAMSMDTEASLRQYLSLQLKLPRAARVGPLAKMFDFVASAAPGVREIVTVGKLCWEVRETPLRPRRGRRGGQRPHRRPAGGPQAINRLVQVGLIRQQTGWMLDILSDPDLGRAYRGHPGGNAGDRDDRAHRPARAETTVSLAGVVVNRVLPELFGTREGQVFEAYARNPARESPRRQIGGRPSHCSTRPGSWSRCAGPGRLTSSACARR